MDEPLPQLQKIKSNDISDELTQETKIDNSITTVSVKDLDVGRDFVARDQHIHLPAPTQFDRYNEQFNQEFKNKETTLETNRKLNHFSSNIDNLRDLETKLKNAGFEYLVDEAIELKQEVTKIIIKYQHYKSAQKIITLVLSNVKSIFNAKIKPKLASLKDESEIKNIFYDELETELEKKLGENVLDLYNDEIQGMTYFLTGNCHIEWS